MLDSFAPITLYRVSPLRILETLLPLRPKPAALFPPRRT
jgi:hypothetical protein